MENKRRIISNELLQTAFDNLLWICLHDVGLMEKEAGIINGELEAKMKEAIRSGRNSKEHMQNIAIRWLDDAIEETIYKNEERWAEFGFDLDDVEDIIEEDSIEEKVQAQVMSFIQNI